jgi:thiol-disulfide isomerase/thioredoxin
MPRICLTLIVVLALVSALSAQSESPILGQSLPALELSHPLQGEAWSAETLKGKIVVLDVFQIGCPSCMSNSLPHAQKLYERFQKDERVAVVAICTAFEKEKYPFMADEDGVKKRLKSEAWNFPVMRDKDEKTVKILGFKGRYGTPTTVVIDGAGTVHWHGFNSTAETAAQVDAKVEELLASFWVAPIPDLNPRFMSYAKGQYGKAWTLANRLLESDSTKPELMDEAKTVVLNIQTGMKRLAEEARAKRAAGEPAAAKAKLDEARKIFKGCGSLLPDLDKEWRKDRAFAKELRFEKAIVTLEKKAAKSPKARASIQGQATRLHGKILGTPLATRLARLID